MESQPINNEVQTAPILSQSPQNPHSKELTKQQKAGVVALALFSTIILGMWFVNLKRDLTYAPTGGVDWRKLQTDDSAAETATNKATTDQAIDKDTDKDGLTDLQETTIYKTSPYIADSDSDGINDGEEVKNGTNPLCPEGKDCSQGGLYGIESSPTSTNSGTKTAAETQAELLKKAFGEKPDLVELRASLLASATDDEKQIINKLTDDQLLEFYNRIISGVSTGGQETAPAGTNSVGTASEKIK